MFSFDGSLLDAVGDVFDWLEPETILGHSLGGWLSARYTADCGIEKRPKVRRRHGYAGPRQIVLVAAAGVYERPEVRRNVEQLFHDLVGEKGFAVLRPHLFAKEPVWFDWVAKDFSKFVTEDGIRQFTDSVRDDHFLQNRLGDIHARTWLLWGDRDTLVPTSGFMTWFEGLTSPESAPQAMLIRGAGHSPQLEKPLVMAAVITKILLASST